MDSESIVKLIILNYDDCLYLLTDDNFTDVYDIIVNSVYGITYYTKCRLDDSIINNPSWFSKIDKNYFIYNYVEGRDGTRSSLIQSTSVIIQCIENVDILNEESVKIIINVMGKRIDLGLGNNKLLNIILTKVEFNVLYSIAVKSNRKNIIRYLDRVMSNV